MLLVRPRNMQQEAPTELGTLVNFTGVSGVVGRSLLYHLWLRTDSGDLISLKTKLICIRFCYHEGLTLSLSCLGCSIDSGRTPDWTAACRGRRGSGWSFSEGLLVIMTVGAVLLSVADKSVCSRISASAQGVTR